MNNWKIVVGFVAIGGDGNFGVVSYIKEWGN